MSYRPKLFVGIELDERTRAECAQIEERIRACGLDGRYEPAEKLHITLAFLGWVDAESVGDIEETMYEVAAAHEPFTMTLDRIGAFPHERRPRVVWIGSNETGPEFRTLAQTLRKAYAGLGFTFDKHAVAHVTIVRTKEPRRPIPMLDSVAPMRLPVKHLALFESLPDKRTTRYEVRSRALLTGPA